MENVIELQNVSKSFKGFQINNFSMEVKKGFVTGFIGGNGSGKSTTIKMIMNLINPDSGNVSLFGMNYSTDAKRIKERIGFVYDDNVFYDELTLKEITKIIAPAYKKWDFNQFTYYKDLFELPLNKKMKTFSKGMKMKASLAIALSHHAELIIMDEPTSGLDPVFRRELLDVLQNIMQDGEKTIFFSSHITTDLDRIADYITLIQNGKHIFTKDIYAIAEDYVLVKGPLDLLKFDTEREFISVRKANTGFEGLIENAHSIENLFDKDVVIEKPSLEDIMYFMKKGDSRCLT
ncbi:ABC transporter ATP-binding protein [Bacillus sp. BB51/4]|uniref:ABC transporter ATP-binding protein n=1 Tax=Bacillus cereus group TaxID=86661 RepID=UPI000B4AA692|nr:MULTISPECIES: ABC transporter ATP-binding protein [Bacillus cereus group]KAA0769805.1 ABC transporter ATP-binding protein [Bacillus sp. BB51/4]